MRHYHWLAAISLLSVLASSVNAAVYRTTFYQPTVSPPSDLFTDYVRVGVGTVAFADSAAVANNLLLVGEPELLSFDITHDVVTERSAHDGLAVDDFPPRESVPANTRGIRFDADAQSLRFDNPDYAVTRASSICEPDCDLAVGNTPTLTLVDENADAYGRLADGTIGSIQDLMNQFPGSTIFRLGGERPQQLGVNAGGAGVDGASEIQQFPIPAAVWLFGSALGLLGWNTRPGSSPR